MDVGTLIDKDLNGSLFAVLGDGVSADAPTVAAETAPEGCAVPRAGDEVDDGGRVGGGNVGPTNGASFEGDEAVADDGLSGPWIGPSSGPCIEPFIEPETIVPDDVLDAPRSGSSWLAGKTRSSLMTSDATSLAPSIREATALRMPVARRR